MEDKEVRRVFTFDHDELDILRSEMASIQAENHRVLVWNGVVAVAVLVDIVVNVLNIIVRLTT